MESKKKKIAKRKPVIVDGKFVKQPKPKLGAPIKLEHIGSDHLRDDQRAWAQDEAAARGIPMWKFLRECIDFAKDSFDRKRGDVEASALFDKTIGEEVTTAR